MGEQIYVVGHKNPDTDCICAAIAYAELLQFKGQKAIPARQGELWPETRYLLEKFGFEEPLLLTDVRPRVRDAMSSPAISVSPVTPIYRIGRIFKERNIRAVPVLDGAGKLAGMVSVEDFSALLLEELDPALLDKVPLDLENLVEIINGRVLVKGRRTVKDKVFVGAMDVPSMVEHLEPDAVFIIGDREDAQRAAIEKGVGAIVVTGGLPVSGRILELAQEKGVTIISSPYHTFTTARLVLLSTPASFVMRREVLTVYEDELLEDVRSLLTRQRTLPVLDGEGRVIGVISRSDFLRPVRYRLVLVDHNERSQTVTGIEEAEVVGIIDHHRVGDIQTPQPVFVRSEPVGATCTIIAGLFAEEGIEIPPPLAGIMLGAIISDTVLFRSPTSTPRDEAVAHRLARIAGIEPQTLAEELFAVASDISSRTTREVLTADFKEFNIGEHRYGIGYMETVNRSQVDERIDEFLAEMKKLREEQGYTSVMFIVVDVPREQTELLVVGKEKEVAEALGVDLASPHSIIIPGVVSRKKQIVPILPRLG